jgi:hypothetical protein
VHVSNLAGQRFHLGFGEQDPQVALEHLEQYTRLLERHGALLDWKVLPGQAHALSLPEQRERRPWGRVELARDGNRVRGTTRREALRVARVPGRVRPRATIVVEVDGRVVFDARAEPSVATLLEWAAIDDDRRVQFAGEIGAGPRRILLAQERGPRLRCPHP